MGRARSRLRFRRRVEEPAEQMETETEEPAE